MARPPTFKQWLTQRRGLSAAALRAELERLDVDTLDRWAYGVVGDDIVTLPTSAIKLVHDDIENAEYQASRYPGGPARWAKSVSFDEPVDVSVENPGEYVLQDGHHRYLAASILGRKLRAKVAIRGKPIEVLLSRA